MVENQNQLIDRDEVIATNDGPDRIVHFTDLLKTKSEEKTNVIRYNLIKFGQLDHALDGFETGELITITGPTGNGKTLLAESLGLAFMENKVNVAWFSFEVPTVKMVEKYRASDYLGLYVPMELKAGNFKWLIDRCLEAKLKHNCRVIIIDHLHFLVDMDTKMNMSLNIGAVMRQIKKTVAVDMNLVVFMLAHQQQGNDDKEPGLNHIRDSSFIGQESDTVVTVFRTADTNSDGNKLATSYSQGWACVKVDKARRAGTYRKKFSYQKTGDFLEEF